MAHRQGYCSERTVYSWVTEDDLEMDLLGAVRDALHANDADHPWLSLSDGEFLRAARLYGRDQLTGSGVSTSPQSRCWERRMRPSTSCRSIGLTRFFGASRPIATTTGLSAGATSSGHTTRSPSSARSGYQIPSCSMGAARERSRRHRPRAGMQPPHPPRVRQRAYRSHLSVSTIICPDSQSVRDTFTTGKSPASRFRYDDRISACRSL